MFTSLCLQPHASDAACSQVDKIAVKVKRIACFATPPGNLVFGETLSPFRHFPAEPYNTIHNPPTTSTFRFT